VNESTKNGKLLQRGLGGIGGPEELLRELTLDGVVVLASAGPGDLVRRSSRSEGGRRKVEGGSETHRETATCDGFRKASTIPL